MKQLKYRDADEYKRGAALNAYYSNRELACSYSREQQCQAQRALDILDTAYAYRHSYVNYRKTFIAVKLEGAVKRDKRWAREALDILENRGYGIVSTPQGLVVRIPRT